MWLWLCVVFLWHCSATIVINVKIELPENSPLATAEAPLVLPPSSGFELLSSTIEVSYVTIVNNDSVVPTTTPSPPIPTPISPPPPAVIGEKSSYSTELIYYSIGLGLFCFLIIIIYNLYYSVKYGHTQVPKPKISVRIAPSQNHQGFIRMSSNGFKVNSRKY